MTDLEITRLCAEAMGHKIAYEREGEVFLDSALRTWYRPLHDDAQAMALVKGFRLEPRYNDTLKAWFVTESYSQRIVARNADLNHAICECVAKMQAAKGAGE